MRCVTSDEIACPLRIGDVIEVRGKIGIVTHLGECGAGVEFATHWSYTRNLYAHEWPTPLVLTRDQQIAFDAAVAQEALRRIGNA